MPQVTIGPEFFKKAKNDYADWKWALVREFFQNSIDCGSTIIEFNVEERDGKTIVTVKNDGDPMTEDIMVNKLLSLGSTGKGFSNGSVGGFGKAKELLYFCWDRYIIQSGSIEVNGSGANYSIKKIRRPIRGTVSTITIDGYFPELEVFARNFVEYSQARQRITINGNIVVNRLRCGYFRRPLDCGRVYTNKHHANLLVVRIGGTPMFVSSIRYNHCVVLELDGTSADVLTSNRDGLKFTSRMEVDQFITDLSTNKRKALSKPSVEVLKFDGTSIKCTGNLSAALQSIATSALRSVGTHEDVTMGTTGSKNLLKMAFTIRNESGRKLPARWRPDSDKFTKYAHRLALLWGKLLITLHEIFDIDDEFSIGFIFNNEIESMHEKSSEGRVYYINPAVIRSTGGWKTRWVYSLADRDRGYQLVITALHEIVHGLGYNDHDESYSSKLTEMAGKLLNHVPEIKKVFLPSNYMEW